MSRHADMLRRLRCRLLLLRQRGHAAGAADTAAFSLFFAAAMLRFLRRPQRYHAAAAALYVFMLPCHRRTSLLDD